MGFLTTLSLYTVIVTFHGTEFIINTKEPVVPDGKIVTFDADGLPALSSGFESEHMTGYNEVNDIYDRSLYQYLGSVATPRRTRLRKFGRININGISRCAMGLPFIFGNPSSMADYLVKNNHSDLNNFSWVSKYLQSIMAQSMDFFKWTMDAVEATNGLYSLETWPVQYTC